MHEIIKIFIENWKEIATILGMLGVAVDVTPIFKIQPIRLVLKILGDEINKGLVEEIRKIDESQQKAIQEISDIKKDLESHKLESQRYEILDFANSCMNRRKHTKEEFDHIISVHDNYEKYIKERDLENGQVKVAYAYIEKLYARCMEKNNFLNEREDENEED